jgi:signal peptidase I
MSYVTVRGVSMAPELAGGDLSVVRAADAYEVGDVVAYRSDQFHKVVLHRIVAKHGDHYTFKGDNNSWLDPERPDTSQLLGTQVVRIPGGGVWRQHLTSPAALGLYAFLLVGATGTTVDRRRRRRRRLRRKTRPMSLTTRHQGAAASLATLTTPLKIAAAATGALALFALLLAMFAWTAPPREATTARQASPRMTFAYSAPVARSAAYDGTRAVSPQPIFRKLADKVDLRYTYRGPAGRIAVNAVLSTASGWTSTVPLMPARSFSGTTYVGTTQLRLSELEARARAAASATGLPSGQVQITLEPTVTSATGTSFTPLLGLKLDPLALSLSGDSRSLEVRGSSSTTSGTAAEHTLTFAGLELTVPTARLLSLGVLALSLLAAAAIAVLARRSYPTGDVEEIQRRWSSLLVRVHPVQAPEGGSVVDVTDPATLVKLAERYGLLILHWTTDEIATYLVQDDPITYRYRTSTTEAAPTSSASSMTTAERFLS